MIGSKRFQRHALSAYISADVSWFLTYHIDLKIVGNQDLSVTHRPQTVAKHALSRSVV